MSSRQEEKEQRRRERLEREAAERRAAKRRRVLQIAGGVVVGVAVLAGAVLAIAGGGEDGREDVELRPAARAAGCTVKTFPSEGGEHVTRKLTVKDYKTNPPTSGPHLPPGQEAQAGEYLPGNEPEIGSWVHTLEHGRIIFMYKPGTPPQQVAKLKALYAEPVLDGPGGYHSVLMRNNTNMPFAVAAVAWRHYIGCPEFNDMVIPAMAAFRETYVDTAPEQVP